MALLQQLRGLGLELHVTGEELRVGPRSALTDDLRALIRSNKPVILQELAIEAPVRGALALVSCTRCRYFESRQGQQPDGYCRRYAVETWSAVAFRCDGYETDAAAQALEGRRRRVERQLREHPELRVAFDATNSPLRPEPGEPVSVVGAVRHGEDILSGELYIPRDRLDLASFLRTVDPAPPAADCTEPDGPDQRDERISDETLTAHYMLEPSDAALLSDYEMREFGGRRD